MILCFRLLGDCWLEFSQNSHMVYDYKEFLLRHFSSLTLLLKGIVFVSRDSFWSCRFRICSIQFNMFNLKWFLMTFWKFQKHCLISSTSFFLNSVRGIFSYLLSIKCATADMPVWGFDGLSHGFIAILTAKRISCTMFDNRKLLVKESFRLVFELYCNLALEHLYLLVLLFFRLSYIFLWPCSW